MNMNRQQAIAGPGQGPVKGRGWAAVGVLFALVAVAFGSWQVISVLAHAESTTNSTVPAAGLTGLRVKTDGGRVTVVTTAGIDEVRVTARLSEGLRGPQLSETTSAGVLTLRGECPAPSDVWCRINYRVEVPPGLTVEVDTDNGDIDVSGVSGTTDLQTANGEIRGTGLRAAVVRAGSDTGDIDLQFDTPPTELSVSSDIGDVSVRIPDDGGAYRLDATTDIGDRQLEVRTDPASNRSIKLSSGIGDLQLRYR